MVEILILATVYIQILNVPLLSTAMNSFFLWKHIILRERFLDATLPSTVLVYFYGLSEFVLTLWSYSN